MREGFSIESGRAKNRKDPSWVSECPALLPGERFYIPAFWHLDTERTSGGLTLGRIPWSKARDYAREELGFGPQMQRVFWKVIYALDTGYRKAKKDEHDRAAKVRDAAHAATAAARGGKTRTKRRFNP